MLHKGQLSSSRIRSYRAWGRGGGLERESRKGEGSERDFRRRAEEEEYSVLLGQKETGPASGNSWCAGDPCWLHAPPTGRREGPASLCESQHGLNVTVSFASMSLYSSDGACSTTHNYIWAPLGDDSNVTGHKGHNIQALNPWLPCRESRLGRVRSLNPTYS